MPPMATVEIFLSCAERPFRMCFVPCGPMIDLVFSLLEQRQPAAFDEVDHHVPLTLE